MTRIDAHIHYMGDTAASIDLLKHFDMKLMNICVAQDSHGEWRWQARIYQELMEKHPDRYAWCTSFDLPRFDDPKYIETTLAELAADFRNGAVACKAWKNFGMGVRKPDGEWMLVDDPLLEPIFAYIAAAGKTLLMHIADPLDGWLPLQPGSPHYHYFSQNPEWHLYGRTDIPSHEALIAARDAVAARHPDLPIVGAHMGSLEHDVDEVAKRLDLYPNFAVDMSARLFDLAIQDPEKVHRFFLKYPDRILFGTDVVTRHPASACSPEEAERTLRFTRSTYVEYTHYLEKSGKMSLRDREVECIALPQAVLEQVYTANAQAWYPGI